MPSILGRWLNGERSTCRSLLAALAPGLLLRLAIACLVAGIGFTTIANAAWAQIGVFCLFAFIVVALPAALPPDLLPAPAKKYRGERARPPMP